MKKTTELPNRKQGGKTTLANTGQNAEVSLHEQVRREFENAEDRGESELDELKSELNEPHYTLPSPMVSREDATAANIDPDQMGEAFGLAF